MNDFGKTLFGGSRFIFWCLAPFLILFAIAMPLLAMEWTLARAVLLIAFEIVAWLLVLGLWNPRRFGWALRVVTALVCGVCVTAIVDELFFSGEKFTFREIISGRAPLGTLKGFAFLGISSLTYTLLGRFFSVREKIKEIASRKFSR